VNELFRAIEPWANVWGASLWRASWQGGLAIIAAWAIARWCTFLSPRIVCRFWRLACLKLLVALLWVQPVAIPVLRANAMPTAITERAVPAPATTRTETSPPRPLTEMRPAAANERSPTGHATIWSWLLTLWVIGVSFRVALTARQWKAVRRLCGLSEPSQSMELQQTSRREADRLGIRRLPRIRFSSRTDVPLLAGIWRPMILLPTGALELFDHCELRLMLGHELAHLNRRDLLWNWLPTVAGWLFFFHPLVWLVPRRWSEAQEAACDELLIQNDSTGAASYGRLLVRLAARWPRERRAELMAAGVLGTYRDLERRILAMIRVRPYSRRCLILTAILIAATGMLVTIPWRLVAQEPPAAPLPKPASGQSQQGSEMLRDLEKKTAPVLAAMAKEHGYGLDNGQNLRRVPPPFPAIRMDWYRIQNPNPAIVDGPSSVVYQWSNDRLGNWRGAGGGSADDGFTILGLLDAGGIKKQIIDGPPELIYKRLPGDWVIRTGASDQQVVKEFAAILRKELSLPIRMEFRNVSRPVYVVNGDYDHKPVPGGRNRQTFTLADRKFSTDVIEIFSKQLLPDSDFGGWTGTYAEFLASLGDWIGAPIVSEVKSPPKNELSWFLHGRSPFTKEMEAEDHDPKLVVANITAQTGLHFREETRTVKILFVSRGE
jgi:beta-lactamase regulating signal transducer with metallopeptidase domain